MRVEALRGEDAWWAVGAPLPSGLLPGGDLAGDLIDPWRVSLTQPLQLCWSFGGSVVAGFGIAAERVATPGQGLSLLDELQRSGVWEGAEELGGFLGPWFGGLAFDLAGSQSWAGFPTARFILPSVLVWSIGGKQGLWAFAAGPDGRDEARRRLEAAQTALAVTPRPLLRSVRLACASDRQGWDALVARALGSIEKGQLEKVVAARKVTVSLPDSVDLVACMEILRERAGHCAAFALRGSDGAWFIGATPERLCRIEGASLETEALASSAPPRCGATLAREDKEQREHSTVVDGIREALAPITSQLTVGAEPRLLELPYVSHLRTPIRATLKPGVGVSRVLGAMYPTAAVGGAPRSAALRFLAQHERFERGWYAGGVGWIGPRGADLHVAIRSALVVGGRAEVFVGAGLVAGSVAEREWQETEDKARPMLHALGEAHLAS